MWQAVLILRTPELFFQQAFSCLSPFSKVFQTIGFAVAEGFIPMIARRFGIIGFRNE